MTKKYINNYVAFFHRISYILDKLKPGKHMPFEVEAIEGPYRYGGGVQERTAANVKEDIEATFNDMEARGGEFVAELTVHQDADHGSTAHRVGRDVMFFVFKTGGDV